MNDFITYSAQAKLHHLIKKDGAAAVKITAPPEGGVYIEVLFTSARGSDIILNSAPKVLTDLFTLSQLSQSSIDFSYSSAEFIIKRGKYDNQSYSH